MLVPQMTLVLVVAPAAGVVGSDWLKPVMEAEEGADWTDPSAPTNIRRREAELRRRSELMSFRRFGVGVPATLLRTNKALLLEGKSRPVPREEEGTEPMSGNELE